MSLPGIERRVGGLHPITLVQMELEQIFQGMGFMVLTGFDAETEHYNFDALNMPADHPSREMQDTYWLTNGMVMRTQTSANQVRALEKYGAPMRAIFPGRCFRFEDVDACHRCVAPDTPDAGGMMGVKLRRPALSSYDTESYLADLESVVVAMMIEKNVAVENLDEILERAVAKGVDMTQWGPADFGFSRGQPGLMTTPEIKPFEELVIRKSLEYGIHPRIEIGAVEQAKRYIDLGVRHFCIGWDRHLYRAALADLGGGMKKLLETV